MESIAADETVLIFFFPHPSRGDTIPLFRAAGLFARRPGIRCTFVTTAGNASCVLPALDAARAAGLPLDLVLLPFPFEEAGLPAGVECTDALPADDPMALHKLCHAQYLLHRPFWDLVTRRRPDAIVSDWMACWNVHIALSFSVPYFVFSGIPPSAKSIAETVLMRDMVAPADGTMVVITSPIKMQLFTSELPKTLNFPDWLRGLSDSERKSSGVIFNTFYELEREFVDYYGGGGNLTGAPGNVFCIGPVQLNNEIEQDSCRRSEIMSWLDAKDPGSVLYVAFGSECRFSPEQLREIATGLQGCNRSFIWAVRRGGGGDGDDIDQWLPESFYQTVGDRGLILLEWAPQMAILHHTATGGFMTHCGWNSAMEGVCAGLPLIAWPLHSEQFLNERLLVEVVGVGMRILDGPGMRSVDAEGKGLVTAEVIKTSVERLMGGEDEEVRAMRTMAKKYQELARAAVKEGGSSYDSLSSVIELTRENKKKKKKINNGYQCL